jgi:hypothetical protein
MNILNFICIALTVAYPPAKRSDGEIGKYSAGIRLKGNF